MGHSWISIAAARAVARQRRFLGWVGMLGLLIGAERVALAAPVASGTLYAECDTAGTACCARFDLAAITYDVFGTPIDMGTGVGSVSTTDLQIVGFNGSSGTFSGSEHAPTAGVFDANVVGSFICSTGNCGSGLINFVSDFTSVSGSFALPSGLTYTSDGSSTLTGGLPASTIAGCSLGAVNVFDGIFGFNAFQSAATPSGSNVTVNTGTTFFDSATGIEVTVSIDATFTDVTSAGSTVVKAYSNAAGVVPGDFAAQVNGTCAVDAGISCCADSECPSGTCDGCYRAAYVDVTTTASFSGPIEICSAYPDGDNDGIVDGTPIEETRLRVLHEEAGVFVDRTSSSDPVGNRICAQVSSLSFFIVAVADAAPPVTQNHYLCRQVKDLHAPAKFVAQTGISLVDQTGSDSCEAKKPFLLCSPVDKNGGGIADPALHYCCYKLKCGAKPAVNYEVTDQFWNGQITTRKPKFLCNPCAKALAP